MSIEVRSKAQTQEGGKLAQQLASHLDTDTSIRMLNCGHAQVQLDIRHCRSPGLLSPRPSLATAQVKQQHNRLHQQYKPQCQRSSSESLQTETDTLVDG